MSTSQAIVLSDLHLTVEGPLTCFRDGVALGRLLLSVLAEDQPPTELVLAGDCFDFLCGPDYAGFDAARAPDRLEAILRAPQVVPVVEALRRAARKHELTVLAGNHDPELLLEPVRSVLERHLDRPGRVRWADDQPLRDREGPRPPVWGRALGPPESSIWVVHGDRWDTSNFVDRDQLRERVAQGERVDLPPGSRLVYEVLRPLVEARPGLPRRWIVELKPELPAVVLLLLYLDGPRVLSWLGRGWRAFLGLVRARVRRPDLLAPDDAPAAEADSGQAHDRVSAPSVVEVTADLVATELAELTDAPEAERCLAALGLHLSGEVAPAPAGALLADHAGPVRLLLRAWLRAVRRGPRHGSLDADDPTPADARDLLPEGLFALVAGHTHGPRLHEGLRPRYVNTGTWTPIGHLPAGDMRSAIDTLERGDWEVDVPRTFAWIEGLDGAAPQIRLGRCDEQGAIRWSEGP